MKRHLPDIIRLLIFIVLLMGAILIGHYTCRQYMHCSTDCNNAPAWPELISNIDVDVIIEEKTNTD